MANEVEVINTIAIASIEAINTRTDANIQALNTLEFAGFSYLGLAWATSTVTDFTNQGGLKLGTSTAGWIGRGGSVKTGDEWNGSSWSVAGATNTHHGAGAAGGTQTAGVMEGGYDEDAADETTVCEEYNGTSWSSGGSLTSGHAYLSGGGYLQTAQLITGGHSFTPTVLDLTATQTYNGTSWTNESVASSGRSRAGVVGTTDKFVLMGGALDGTAISSANQYWNGSSWASIATASEPAYDANCFGDETRAFKAGGRSSNTLGAPNYYANHNNVETWVSDSWSTETVLPAAVSAHGYGGGEGSGGETASMNGWTAGGFTRSGSSNTNVNSHYIASNSA